MLIDQLPSANPNLTDETVTEQGTNLFRTTWQKIRDLFFGSSASFASDVTVGGVLDVVPRRCFGVLSSPGWYRVCRFNAPNSFDVLGADGTILNIYIGRVYQNTTNDVHKISLLRTYNNNKFIGEDSVSNTLGVDGIRLTYHDGGSGDRYAYIDIHYALSTANDVAVHFDVFAAQSGNNYTDKWFAESLQNVALSPANETVQTEYGFIANTGTQIPFTPIAGSNYASYGGCWYSRIGNLVHLHIGMSGLTANTQITVYQLPTGLRPVTPAASVGVGGLSYTAIARLTVATDGKVNVVSDDSYASIDITYLTSI